MLEEKFVKKIRETVINDGVNDYKELFETTKVEETSDLYWENALTFYKKLDNTQREILFDIIRQVSLDTVSHMLGILDGTSFLDEFNETFKLSYGKIIINGDLQDFLLEQEE